MSDPTEEEIDYILIRLNPNAKQCRTCDRYYDEKLHNNIVRTHQTCFYCWLMTFECVDMYRKFGKEYLERVFYNQYDIVPYEHPGFQGLKFQKRKKNATQP